MMKAIFMRGSAGLSSGGNRVSYSVAAQQAGSSEEAKRNSNGSIRASRRIAVSRSVLLLLLYYDAVKGGSCPQLFSVFLRFFGTASLLRNRNLGMQTALCDSEHHAGADDSLSLPKDLRDEAAR